MTALNVLLDAWLAWDLRPRSEHHARAVTAAAAVFAAELGVSSVLVRRRMAEGRRARIAHDTILDGLVADHTRQVA